MKIDLRQYLMERRKTDKEVPVVTISRDHGCNAMGVAQQLAVVLNMRHHDVLSDRRWHIVNKEIVAESAKELNLPAGKVKHVFTPSEKGFVTDLVESFSSEYDIFDKQMRVVIKNTINRFAKEGHTIIVGRGGSVCVQEFKKSLHIRITAPLEWRVKNIQERFKLSHEDAVYQAEHIDEGRKILRDKLYGKPTETIELFDCSLNAARMTEHEMVAVIANLVQERKLS